MQKKEFKVKQSKPVVICVFDKNLMKEYIGLQTILRKSGISTEIYPGENKLKKQMEYANKIKSPAVILYGEDEIKSGKYNSSIIFNFPTEICNKINIMF